MLKPVELPEPAHPEFREVFPDVDLQAAAPGTPLNRAYASFGKQGAAERPSTLERRCIFFQYDPEFFAGALVILGNQGRVERSWVVTGVASPTECSGLPHEKIDLTGWYAAAVRRNQTWLPEG